MPSLDPFSGIVGHEAATQVLWHALARPHHAYLLVGGDGLGAGTIAERFARALIGASLAADAAFSSHPDVVMLARLAGDDPTSPSHLRDNASGGVAGLRGAGAGPKAQISVEAVREFRERVSRKPIMASRIVAMVPEADLLNEAGGNALLKCLEEPPAGTVFVMAARNESRLPETVKSRSVVLRLSPVPAAEIERWLAERGTGESERREAVRFAVGHPGRALRWLADADMRVREAEAARTVDAILSSTTPGHAVAVLDADARRADAAEDTLAAWQDLLDRLMRAVRDRFADAPLPATRLGSALALARRRAGGPVSPRVWMELALIRHI